MESLNISKNLGIPLYEAVAKDYADVRNKRERWKKIKENPYYNALQVKFAYAITCHKAQGGQWKAVFVDHGYITEEMLDTVYYRWLYTAFTRPTEKLYLVNFIRVFLMGRIYKIRKGYNISCEGKYYILLPILAYMGCVRFV